MPSTLILSEGRRLRLFSFFSFYFMQGMPIGITMVALPIWLAANGGDASDVAGIVAVVQLPWSIKWIIAAVMDRYPFLQMGRRRAWLFASQISMVSGFGTAAAFAPTPGDVELLTVVSFLLMAGAAMHDVAVDGLSVDMLPEAEQGIASAFMQGGQSIGRACAIAVAGFALHYIGSRAAFLLFLIPIAMIMLFTLLIHERPGEKRLPWSKGEASQVNLALGETRWLEIFKTTLRALMGRDSILLVIAAACSRAAGGILIPLLPILATAYLAFGTSGYSSMVSTIELVMAVVSIAVGSILTLKLGPRRSSMAVSALYIAICAFIILGREFIATIWIFVAMFAVYALVDRLEVICINPMRMQLSLPKVAATQFTIYNSLSNFPIAIGALLFARLGGADNLEQVMLVAIGLFAAALIAMALLSIGGPPKQADAAPLSPARD